MEGLFKPTTVLVQKAKLGINNENLANSQEHKKAVFSYKISYLTTTTIKPSVFFGNGVCD